MDSFSADGELFNLQNALHQGRFTEALQFDITSLLEENKLPAQVLQLRALIALGKLDEVISKTKGKTPPELIAVGALAEFLKGNVAEALSTVESLNKVEGAALVPVGTILQGAGKSEEALALLGTHQANLEAVALIVQIHLQQNRTDLAIKEVAAARRWAQDSLLVNLAESWVGLRVGGEKYQQAFYVFEELAQASSTCSSLSLIWQAIAEIHLGRLDEAEAALKQVLAKDENNADAIANTIVLSTISGQDTSQLLNQLKASSPNHIFLHDIQEKESLFDKAASKFSAKVAAV
ncbi:hypothetical protein K3495_g1560 [Podosphaera aphanis]|nr:hypothetical protein K3495_g1560 [Podosphaera aphanis]